jgi:hypothetical protein
VGEYYSPSSLQSSSAATYRVVYRWNPNKLFLSKLVLVNTRTHTHVHTHRCGGVRPTTPIVTLRLAARRAYAAVTSNPHRKILLPGSSLYDHDHDHEAKSDPNTHRCDHQMALGCDGVPDHSDCDYGPNHCDCDYAPSCS